MNDLVTSLRGLVINFNGNPSNFDPYTGNRRCNHYKISRNDPNFRGKILKIAERLPHFYRNVIKHKCLRLFCSGKSIEIYCGPVYQANQAIVRYKLKNDKAIAQGCFYIINNGKKVKSYVLPNSLNKKRFSLKFYKTTIKDVEKLAGLFFKSLHKSSQKNCQKPQVISSCFIKREGYELEYDFRTRNPRWVHEQLSPSSLKKTVTRKNRNFKSDPYIPENFRTQKRDFAHPFSKGHLAAAANHASTPSELNNTFYLSNISPQHVQFNQGLMSFLENHIRSLALHCRRLDVVTGPLYLPKNRQQNEVRYSVMGKMQIAVPTHFFKICCCHTKNGKAFRAYLLPNQPIKTKDFSKFRISLQKMEKLTKLNFQTFFV